jgi:hypothetical protein
LEKKKLKKNTASYCYFDPSAMASFFNLCFPWLKSKESRSADMSTQPDNSHDHPSDTKDIHCMRKSDENSKRILRTANYETLMVTACAASRRSTHLPVAKGERPEVGHTFSWAEKYQPKALKDFICHREKAESIRSTVCFYIHLHEFILFYFVRSTQGHFQFRLLGPAPCSTEGGSHERNFELLVLFFS